MSYTILLQEAAGRDEPGRVTPVRRKSALAGVGLQRAVGRCAVQPGQSYPRATIAARSPLSECCAGEVPTALWEWSLELCSDCGGKLP